MPTPKTHTDPLEAALSMGLDEVREELRQGGVEPESLLAGLRALRHRLEKGVDAQDEQVLDDILSMGLDEVREELRAAGVDPHAAANRIMAHTP